MREWIFTNTWCEWTLGAASVYLVAGVLLGWMMAIDEKKNSDTTRAAVWRCFFAWVLAWLWFSIRIWLGDPLRERPPRGDRP